jgi:hypothetical protein
VVERLERGPGVVSRVRIELELPLGTAIERINVRPRDDRRSAVAHLFRSPRSTSETVRTELSVGPAGVLRRPRASG